MYIVLIVMLFNNFCYIEEICINFEIFHRYILDLGYWTNYVLKSLYCVHILCIFYVFVDNSPLTSMKFDQINMYANQGL